MSPDGITLHLITCELQNLLIQGRVDRIFQPERQEIVLNIRNNGINYRLLISARAESARLHLTGQETSNPATPPLFCLILRKYLEGSRLQRIEQTGLDRVVTLTFSHLGESGQFEDVTLISEIMGKHSNLILVDPSSGIIIDGLKRYSHLLSRYREVLPGRPYLAPPEQHKIDPRELDEEQFVSVIMSNSLNESLGDMAFRHLSGVGPDLVREIFYRANLDPDLTLEYCGSYELLQLWLAMRQVLLPLLEGQSSPTAYYRGQHPVACSSQNLFHFRELRKVPFTTVNAMLDSFNASCNRAASFQQLHQRLATATRHEVERCQKKLGFQQQTLIEIEQAQKYRLQGEMLYAHLHLVQPGQKEVMLPNLYEPEGPTVKVNLNPNLSAAQNAQRLFRKYDKARDSKKIVTKQRDLTASESDYLNSVQVALEQAETPGDLEDIRLELEESGYLKVKPVRQKGKKAPKNRPAPPQVMRIRAADGSEILIGKNNKQNDYLTMRLARDDDLWLHVKGNAGAHVIIKATPGRQINPTTLELAAGLAAYFSSARQSGKVAVDYTRRKHVSKPAKARPGYVIYKEYETAYVAPVAPDEPAR